MPRKQMIGVVLCLALITAGVVMAQESEATFITDMMTDFERTAGRLVELAEATPEDKFSWAPNEEVRTVSRVYMHVVGTNMLLPGALGAAAPEGLEMPEGGPMAMLQQLEQEYTSKDEVIAMLKKSIDYAKTAVPQIEDLETEVDLFGFPATKRAYLLILLTHAHEHLGQSIAYARSVGVVPPWSQQQGN